VILRGVYSHDFTRAPAWCQGAKLEIESVLRETCDRVLNPESGLPQNKLALRATALEILGEAFMAAQKDTPSILDADYVRVETQSSKARYSGTYSK
jgi:X-domain of DnaJ-containing